ncbi:hypothetical protein ACFVAM_33545 [Streptomyces californicus]|uniref:hypothetical protein n=1 Tax=Streptomyces californicus TaxID=67351 RepID=UPI003686FA7A
MTRSTSPSSGAAPDPGSPSAPPPARRDLRSALAPGAIGVLLVLAAAVLFATLPGKLSEVHDFRAARPCVEAAVPENGDCLATWPAAAVAKESRREKRSDTRLVTVDPGDGPPVELELRGAGPVFGALESGDRVTVHSWRGTVWALSLGELRQDVVGKPGPGAAARFAVALALLITGAVLVRAAFRWSLRHTRDPAVHAWQTWVPFTATAAAVGLAVTAALTVDGVLPVLLITAAGCAVAGTASALLTRALGRRATDVVTLEPRVLTAERVVRATVAGKVPYSIEGNDHLALAPGPVPGGRGRLATTPDAYGKVVLRPLPETLVPVRLRSVHLTDPHYGRRSSEVVLECRDGEAAVLILAERPAMRWILGALPLPPPTPDPAATRPASAPDA